MSCEYYGNGTHLRSWDINFRLTTYRKYSALLNVQILADPAQILQMLLCEVLF